jgi:uncharacterized protein YeaO (DUF488 family)
MPRKKLRLTTFRIGTPRRRGEGLRIGTVRFLPRGVHREDYARLDYFDVWLPTLAPSRALLAKAKSSGQAMEKLFDRYRSEMHKTEPRQLIELLVEIAGRTPIAIGCYCEDERRCHRSVLLELIRAAARGQE